jgi:hypothetical protein
MAPRPVSEAIAIVTVACPACLRHRGENCVSNSGKEMHGGMHGDRLTEAQFWRKRNHEKYQRMRLQYLNAISPEYGSSGC